MPRGCREKRALTAGCFLVPWLPLLVIGCDPAQDAPVPSAGPAFLIAAPAAVQTGSRLEGTTMYVQARGGTHVGLTAYGGTLRYSALGAPAAEACAELPTDGPLYVTIKPDREDPSLEVRLYADCDITQPGGTALEMCQNHDWYVQSVIVRVPPRTDDGVFLDAGVDAARTRDAGDGGGDARADGARPSDASSSDARNERSTP